jgi:Haem-binding uptake, Tiki superfamily, ChaN
MFERTKDTLALILASAGVCGACAGPDTGRPTYIKQYVDAHYSELGDSFLPPLTRTEFLKRLKSTRVLYIGDHHRDQELHHQIVDLVGWICARGLRPVIGMEALGSQDNKSLQEFLSGGIEFEALRRRVARRWPLSWLERDGVDHDFFRRLLQQARRRRLDAFPLEPTPRLPLAQRDALMATTIRRVLRLYPNRLIIVIVGHAHIMGDGHLRGRVGAESLAIGARCSPALMTHLADQLPIEPTSFLRSNRGVLFFPEIVATRLSD